MRRGVVLIGNFRPSASVARAAAALGRPVAAGLFGDTAYVEWSHAVRDRLIHPPLDTDPDAAHAALRQFFDARRDYGVLLPISEVAARFGVERREDFGPQVVVASPQTAIVRLVAEKDRMCARCDALDVPVAPYAVVRGHAEALDAARRLGYPVVVKPANSVRYLHDRKAEFAADEAQLRDVLPEWPVEHDRLIVQRRVVGPRLIVLFGAVRGRILGAMTLLATRTTEREDLGQTCGAQVIDTSPTLRRHVETLAADLGYSGIGSMEWMVDAESGAVSFLEINPRFDGTSSMAEACGLPLTRWAIEISEGETPQALADPYGLGAGRRMTWSKGDVTRLMSDARHGQIDHAFVSFAIAAAVDVFRGDHTTFALADPGPAIGNNLNPIVKRLRRPSAAKPIALPALTIAKADER